MSTVSSAVGAPLSVDAAREYVYETAFSEGRIGSVGLEVESHLVNLADVSRRVCWDRVEAAADALGSLPSGSKVTIEPGGQIELSGPPASGVQAAINAMRHDSQRARLVLAESRLGLAFVGADALRPPRRINPRPRYRAMEQHFASTGVGDAARTMMTCTAALQVNLQAGPRAGWKDRFHLAQRLGPTLLAISACSPWLAGRPTGWRSARERAWFGLDQTTSGPLRETEDPAAEWTHRALAAPVLFSSAADGSVWPVARRVSFGDWASGAVPLEGRIPTLSDLQTHMTTLFPPVRPRGYLELRFLDMTPPRWWPAIAAVTAALLDDASGAELAAEAVEPVARAWTVAARDGLRSPLIQAAARQCVAIAAARVEECMTPAVTDLAELVDAGRSPGDVFEDRIAEIGVEAAFGESAHA